MALLNATGGKTELESLRTEIAQLREIVAALVNLVVEAQSTAEGEGEFEEDEAYLPEVGTGQKFGWGM
jgi:hypothetical protein